MVVSYLKKNLIIFNQRMSRCAQRLTSEMGNWKLKKSLDERDGELETKKIAAHEYNSVIVRPRG